MADRISRLPYGALVAFGILLILGALAIAAKPHPRRTFAAPVGQSAQSFAGEWLIDLGAAGTGRLTLTPSTQANSRTVTGTYGAAKALRGRLTGAVTTLSDGSLALSGRWSDSRGSGTFVFALVNSRALQFRGNSNGRDQWCGWKSGSTRPNPCLRK